MAYQSLYRRYRPQRFSEIRGQNHVVSALQNAVVKGEVGHAYLLHGPRGTGKTSSARVLAKALNCDNRADDGEPCGECESCLSIEQGRSFDLHELDAASNNGVDAMRELIAKVSLGTPGRAKVYILDEVHMLTAGAENALLKTLEEPPSHVTWVLATTEPHKVVSTIQSRCQVFELSLLGAEEMESHVRWIVGDAELDVDDAVVEHVVTSGGGSVRDTLSALDRVVAAGGVVEIDNSTTALLEGLANHDAAAALGAVVEATGRGRDPRRIGENAVAGLRDAFLMAMGAPPPTLSAGARQRAEALSAQMSPAGMTRALETIGTALIDMRQAPDPRVALEVALVRVCRVETDQSVEALTQRIEQLERRLGGDNQAPPASTPPAPTPPAAPSRSSAPATPPAVPDPVAAEAGVSEAEATEAGVSEAGVSDDPEAEPEAAAASTAAVGGSAGPAAARRAMANRRSGSAEPTPEAGAALADIQTEAPPRLPPPVPQSLPSSQEDPALDIANFVPSSAGEVVAMATKHLGVTKDQVIEKANELLGERTGGGSRSQEELASLWSALLKDRAPEAAEPEQVPAPESGAPAADPDPAPDPNEEIDLHELVDAPDHEDQLLEQLSQAFPGAELMPANEDQED